MKRFVLAAYSIAASLPLAGCGDEAEPNALKKPSRLGKRLKRASPRPKDHWSRSKNRLTKCVPS